MKYCFNCGNKLIKNSKYCDKCGSKIVNNNESNNKDDEINKWMIYIIIWEILVLCSKFISGLSFIFFALKLVVVITAKIKYPKVLFVNIIFWIELIYSICSLFIIFFFFATCGGLIGGIEG